MFLFSPECGEKLRVLIYNYVRPNFIRRNKRKEKDRVGEQEGEQEVERNRWQRRAGGLAGY